MHEQKNVKLLAMHEEIVTLKDNLARREEKISYNYDKKDDSDCDDLADNRDKDCLGS